MKRSLKLLIVWSVFLFLWQSTVGMFSFQDDSLKSNFWNVKNITYADNDRYERDWADEDDNDDYRYNKQKVIKPAPIVTVNTNSTSPINTQKCTTVYDTVTSPSGTTSQVPRQSCTTVPVTNTQPAVIKPVQTNSTKSPVVTPASQNTVNTNNSQYSDWTFIWVGKYSFPGGGVDYSVSLTILNGKIIKASFVNFTVSGNWKYTQAQWDAALQKIVNWGSTTIDTVTWATWTSTAIQDAVNDALSKATKLVVANTTANQVNSVTPTVVNTLDTKSSSAFIPVTAPNWKIYKIHQLSDKKYIYERIDWTISSTKFATYESVVWFINANNHKLEVNESFVAPNWKKYTIIKDITANTFTFKRPDGTIYSKSFATKTELGNFVIKNNTPPVIQVVKAPVKKTISTTIVSQPKKVVTTPVLTSTINKTPTKSTPVTPVVNNQAAIEAARLKALADAKASAALAASQAQAKAQAAAKAQAQAVATAAAQKAAQAAAKPVIDTTTKAS